MEKLSNRKTNVLEVLDTEIKKLEKALEKAQPLFDELNQLKRTRATLLNERTATGNVGKRTGLTMETVIHAMRTAGAPITAAQLASDVGVDATVVRSHLNRYNDVRYRKVNGNEWELIGTDSDTPSDDSEEDDDD